MKKTQTSEAPRLWVDPELVARAKAGDQAAFTELYELTSTGLYRTIHAMVRDEDLAWDIQQDSYLQAFRALDKLEANEAFLSWLRRIAVNVTSRKMAERRPLTFTDLTGEEDEGEPEIPDLSVAAQPELALDRKETSRLVREILKGLPEEQQLIVGMRYYEDMPIQEIADTLHVSLGTVKAQLFRGRKKVEAGVRTLEKQGVKLYGLSPLPFLLALLGRLEPSAQAEKKVLAAILAETPAATAAAGTVAGSSAATVTALTAGQFFLKGLGAKLLAGVLALSLIAVGGKLAYDALADRKVPPIGIERPTAEETVAPKDTFGLVEEDTVSPVEEDTAPETDQPKLYAPDDAPENACGPNLTWRFDEATGTLTIEGSGEMYDYIDEAGSALPSPPWLCYAEQILQISLPEGLSSIGDGAFCACQKLERIDIPETVSAIGSLAFYECVSLSELTFPEGISSIGSGAFYGCSLRELTIPGSVASIGNSAFYRCRSLSSVTIQDGVRSIGYNAFANCPLEEVAIPASVTSLNTNPSGPMLNFPRFTVSPENSTYSSDPNGSLYSKDQTVLIRVPSSFQGTFEIPEGVRSIGDGAFKGCDELTAVTFPDGLSSIGSSAFEDCNCLSSVTLPDGLITIGDSAFSGCGGLSEVRLPDGLVSIGDQAFLFTCLSEVRIPASVSSIGNSAFVTDRVIQSFYVAAENPSYWSDPDGVLYNKDRTVLIRYAGYRESYSIPEGVESIAEQAFVNCESLYAVTIPEGLRSIGDSAFENCYELSELTLPDSLISIGNDAFSGCGLCEVTVPRNVSSIGTNAFFNCPLSFSVSPENAVYSADDCGVLFNKEKTVLIRMLNSSGTEAYSIPESVTEIGSSAFDCCTCLRELTIPDSVTVIGDFAFQYCSDLTALTIPNSVVSIGGLAFDNCVNLQTIQLPEGLSSIPDRAFIWCSRLSEISLPDSLSSIETGAFLYCTGLREVTIPDGVQSIGEFAFSGCTALRAVTIPASVRTIDHGAFGDCPELTLRGAAGSEAERYANENDIPFEAIP